MRLAASPPGPSRGRLIIGGRLLLLAGILRPLQLMGVGACRGPLSWSTFVV